MHVATGPQTLSELPARERVEMILSRLDCLPTLPAVVTRLLAVTSSADSCAQDVIEIIESDASLTSTVLRMARRANLGIDMDTLTLASAVKLLGFSSVRNMVLATQIHQAFYEPEANKQSIMYLRGIWLHNIAVACTAEFIAEQSRLNVDKSEAFLCGLLHDIGKIALDTCLPKSYSRVFERVKKSQICICDAEHELFGLDHTVAGKRLLTRWDLPQVVVDCAWLHHQSPDAIPSSVSNQHTLRIVHLADNLVRQYQIGYSGYAYITEVIELASDLGLNKDDLADIQKRLPVRMDPLKELLGLNVQDHESVTKESLLIANQKLSQLNAKLSESNRSLQMRSSFFDTIKQFTNQLSKDDRIVDICRIGASCIRKMTNASEVLVIIGEAPHRCIHVGIDGIKDKDASVSVIDMGESEELRISFDHLDKHSPSRIIPAPIDLEPIWNRCISISHDLPMWIMAIQCSEGVKGAAIFKADPSDVLPYQSASNECEALSTSIGLAVISAKARIDAERMSEDLFDLNRRLRITQKKLLRTQSLSMIAEMAAGAAHEMNNPLSVISGRAQLALNETDEPNQQKGLEIIIEQTKKATQIVTDLMNFAKPETPKPAIYPLIEIIESLCQCWREGCKIGQEPFSISLADRSLTVYADPHQLNEMIGAVLTNAMEAIDPISGHVKINSPSHLSDETIRIVIEDNGVGMNPHVLEHAIDPFFSSRPAGRGRGLGLSRAYRLAEINGGRLWLESTINVGSTVTIELPSCAPKQSSQ